MLGMAAVCALEAALLKRNILKLILDELPVRRRPRDSPCKGG